MDTVQGRKVHIAVKLAANASCGSRCGGKHRTSLQCQKLAQQNTRLLISTSYFSILAI
jgi:hypothetical protein